MYKSILSQALKVAGSGGERDYEHPLINFLRISIAWSRIANTVITPIDYTLMMFELKIQREIGRHNNDNFVDIIGYGKCISEIEEVMLDLGYDGLNWFFNNGLSIQDMETLLQDVINRLPNISVVDNEVNKHVWEQRMQELKKQDLSKMSNLQIFNWFKI